MPGLHADCIGQGMHHLKYSMIFRLLKLYIIRSRSLLLECRFGIGGYVSLIVMDGAFWFSVSVTGFTASGKDFPCLSGKYVSSTCQTTMVDQRVSLFVALEAMRDVRIGLTGNA